MQGQTGQGGGAGLAGALQNRNVQIGLAVVGVLIIVGAGVALFMSMSGSGGESGSTASQAQRSPSVAAEEAAGGGTATLATGSTSSATGVTTGMPLGGFSTAAPAAATTSQQGGDNKPALPPGVPTRANPFAPTPELERVKRSVPRPPPTPEAVADAHDLYQELNPPKPPVQVVDDAGDTGGPPIPPMRVAGFVEGAQLSAILQIGSGVGGTYVQAIPGKVIRYGAFSYRVESLEQGKVTLVNRWEIGNRKGTQRIEVTLQAAANRLAGAPTVGGVAGPESAPGDDEQR